MENDFKDLKLVNYLRKNLTFGCIKSFDLSIHDYDGNKDVVVILQPYRAFNPSELNVIRNSVLESKDLHEIVGRRCLKNLDLRFDMISAFYKFS